MEINKPSKEGGTSAGNAPERSIKVVAIGGGSGLSTLLKGLKRYLIGGPGQAHGVSIGSLSAVVTVSDDGGSSGRLRKEFGILPPGDIRNCIVALSEDEALLSRLFQYRFSEGSGLSGHTLGNLFLTALTSMTGDFAEAVKLSCEVLATCGTIYPATAANIDLEALMDDGSWMRGETNISNSAKRIIEMRLTPPQCESQPQTLAAITEADLITIGPGSLFTSLIPNLLVGGIAKAIASSRALKVFICNLMTEANESIGLTAAGHIKALYTHAGRPLFNLALVNNRPISEKVKENYARERATQIVVDSNAIEALGVRVVLGDFLEESGGVARHATDRVANELMHQFALRVSVE